MATAHKRYHEVNIKGFLTRDAAIVSAQFRDPDLDGSRTSSPIEVYPLLPITVEDKRLHTSPTNNCLLDFDTEASAVQYRQPHLNDSTSVEVDPLLLPITGEKDIKLEIQHISSFLPDDETEASAVQYRQPHLNDSASVEVDPLLLPIAGEQDKSCDVTQISSFLPNVETACVFFEPSNPSEVDPLLLPTTSRVRCSRRARIKQEVDKDVAVVKLEPVDADDITANHNSDILERDQLEAAHVDKGAHRLTGFSKASLDKLELNALVNLKRLSPQELNEKRATRNPSTTQRKRKVDAQKVGVSKKVLTKRIVKCKTEAIETIPSNKILAKTKHKVNVLKVTPVKKALKKSRDAPNVAVSKNALKKSHGILKVDAPKVAVSKMVVKKSQSKQNVNSLEVLVGIKKSDCLTNHKNVLTGGKRYTCPWIKCTWQFDDWYKLQRHFLVHKKETPYKCHVCEASFVYPRRLTSHIKQQH